MSNSTKWYLVEVKTTVEYLVEVDEDGEAYGDSYNEAIDFATGECPEFDDVSARHVTGHDLDVAKRDLDPMNISSL